jgi:uncharacterized damage-inducible protein DinB
MDLRYQYDLIISSRQALLGYCERISEKDFVAENSSFGRGSIRNLLVHIGNIYEFWIGKHALNLEMNFTVYDSVKSLWETRIFFLNVDSLMNRFIVGYSGKQLEDLKFEIDDREVTANPFKLFTHVITHEFHHKGQILSLSRHLGYIPIDTDVIR